MQTDRESVLGHRTLNLNLFNPTSGGHAFSTFGSLVGYNDSAWISGVLRERIGSGWVQPGFSGTPVWDEQLDGVCDDG